MGAGKVQACAQSRGNGLAGLCPNPEGFSGGLGKEAVKAKGECGGTCL